MTEKKERSGLMSEGRIKGFYEKVKEFLEIVAVIITIIAGVLAIVTIVYVPNSVAFEMAKYLFLVMIPIAALMIVLRFRLRDIRKELETKLQVQTLPNLEQEKGRLDRRMDKIETDIGIVKGYARRMDRIESDTGIVKRYFDFKCPNCSNPMFLPILPSMVIRTLNHEKDGHPDKFQGYPEYEIGCPSCQKTWHIVFRK